MSKSAPKQRISDQERQQAEFAARRWNERVNDGYLELERRAIADAGADHSSVMAGRASGDIAKLEHTGLRNMIPGGASNRDVSDFQRGVGSGVNTSRVDTAGAAKGLRDSSLLGIANLGRNVSGTAGTALKAGAMLSADRGRQKVENEIIKSNAKTDAVLSAASGAATGSALRYEGFRRDGLSLKKTNEQGWNGARLNLNETEMADHLAKPGNQLSWWRVAGV